ncbi:MAG: DUF1287 domain-containing protein [Candidatus Cloacimonetes bacterium]|nr:DUF1287 domain-containing protein [Candidatus Cloacimonadota bacterium]
MKKLLVIFLILTSFSVAENFYENLSKAAILRLESDVTYDGKYLKIDYPNGDVPQNIGVCTDLVIRSYRTLGIDLQKEVHEDMKSNFEKYPKRWGLTRTDTNIDHRRVPNLRRFFERKGTSLGVSKSPKNYKRGDLVTWNVQNLPHIGIVSHLKSKKTKNPLIVHNIGRGPELEDFLFNFPITGHYRFTK